MSAAIEGRGLVKCFSTDGALVRAVDEVDICVEGGELMSIMGPSGCGKSTLLHLLGGLDRTDAGDVSIAGESTRGLSETRWAQLRRRHVALCSRRFTSSTS